MKKQTFTCPECGTSVVRKHICAEIELSINDRDTKVIVESIGMNDECYEASYGINHEDARGFRVFDIRYGESYCEKRKEIFPAIFYI